MEPMPPALEAWSLNHWTTREAPRGILLWVKCIEWSTMLDPENSLVPWLCHSQATPTWADYVIFQNLSLFVKWVWSRTSFAGWLCEFNVESRFTPESVSRFPWENWLANRDSSGVRVWTQWGGLRTTHRWGRDCPCPENRDPAGWCRGSVCSAHGTPAWPAGWGCWGTAGRCRGCLHVSWHHSSQTWGRRGWSLGDAVHLALLYLWLPHIPHFLCSSLIEPFLVSSPSHTLSP